MPVERAVLGLFCDVVLAADLGTDVGDIGCGTGRLEPYLAARGLSPPRSRLFARDDSRGPT
jgi:SAM-dependent methyltransferase